MAVKKQTAKATNDAEKVAAFMAALDHPLKAEIEATRAIILNADGKISERIKWNAPSYYYKEDLATFNPRRTHQVHIVFHHPAIVNITSRLLEGTYIDRRMIYFKSMEEILAGKEELENIMMQLIEFIDNKLKDELRLPSAASVI